VNIPLQQRGYILDLDLNCVEIIRDYYDDDDNLNLQMKKLNRNIDFQKEMVNNFDEKKIIVIFFQYRRIQYNNK
jgi:hypothetical protein